MSIEQDLRAWPLAIAAFQAFPVCLNWRMESVAASKPGNCRLMTIVGRDGNRNYRFSFTSFPKGKILSLSLPVAA